MLYRICEIQGACGYLTKPTSSQEKNKKIIQNLIAVVRTYYQVPVALVCHAPDSNQQWPSPTLLFANIQFRN